MRLVLKTFWFSVLFLSAGCVQRPPVTILMRDGYSAGELRRLPPRRPLPSVVPTEPEGAYEMSEEEGALRLILSGNSAIKVMRLLHLAAEDGENGRTGTYKTGVHLQCSLTYRGPRCSVLLHLPEGDLILSRPLEALKSAAPEGPAIPEENEWLKIDRPEEGGGITWKLNGDLARDLMERIPETREGFWGRFLRCSPGESPTCQIEFAQMTGRARSISDGL
jgi:hypothetical protein